MDANKSISSFVKSDKSARAIKDDPDSPKRKDRKSLKRVGDYVLGNVLGEGSYGQVTEGLYVPSDLEASKDASLVGQSSSDKLKFGQRVAVKIIRRRLLTRKVRNGQENLKREIACLKRLKHQNVIQLYETMDDPSMDKIYLVFELANFLSLQDILDLTTQKHGDSGDSSASFKVHSLRFRTERAYIDSLEKDPHAHF
jgi:serine/threonine-protein kinase 11